MCLNVQVLRTWGCSPKSSSFSSLRESFLSFRSCLSISSLILWFSLSSADTQHPAMVHRLRAAQLHLIPGSKFTEFRCHSASFFFFIFKKKSWGMRVKTLQLSWIKSRAWYEVSVMWLQYILQVVQEGAAWDGHSWEAGGVYSTQP